MPTTQSHSAKLLWLAAVCVSLCGCQTSKYTGLLEGLDHLEDIDLLYRYMEYFQHHNGLDDPPGSFKLPIAVGYRILELDPHDVYMYSAVSGLLLSKWVNWKDNPVTTPDGGDKIDEAYNLLLNGRDKNSENALYHKMVGDTFQPYAKFHDHKYYPFVIDSYELADKNTDSAKLKSEMRYKIAYIYFKLGDSNKANLWFSKTIETQAANQFTKAAKRLINSI